ncbi:MAG: peptidase S9 [Marinilabiliales bacterium]|nr:MAG: peptidase S9 [Marinilabiliales bacterium]
MYKLIVLLGLFVFLFSSCCDKYPECRKQEEQVVEKSMVDSLSRLTITESRLTPETLWKFGRVGGSVLSPDGKIVAFSVTRYDYTTNKSYTDVFKLDVTNKETKQLTDFIGPEFNIKWKPNGEKIGFIATESGDAQIWEINPDGTEPVQVSFIEGGINSFEYSPDGSRVLYTKDVKLDKTPNEIYEDLPLANVHMAEDLMYRHWNSWHDYKYSHIFVAKIKDGKVIDGTDIMEGEKWDAPLSPYFDPAEMTWSPDGKLIAYTCKKLTGMEYALSTNSDIYLYNVDAKKTENISEGLEGYDKYPRFSPDGKKIAWECMITPGYESDKVRLYVYDFESKTKEDLTVSIDQNVSHLVWDESGEFIYFISGVNATYQICKINTGTREWMQITKGPHNYTSFEKLGNLIIAEKMSMSMATEIFKVEEMTGKDEQLSYINKNIYDKVEMGKVEERWIRTYDGKQMLVWVIYPPQFDETKKYPALLYCQGGPQSAVSQFFSYRWNFQMMAANDYIIVAPNRRGLPSFGEAWNAQISGDYGGKNMRDYLTAIDELSKEDFIDEERLGAVGASYGGFSVYWLAGHHKKRFKAFISHCGMFNLESQYAATEEMFFVNHDLGGPYWKKPQPRSYRFSPHLYVDKWDTPILIISGEYDFRIPYTESLQAFNAAKLNGVDAKLLIFPEESHFVLKPQNSILWQREFFGWLDKYLK